MNSAHSRVASKTAVVTGGRGDIGAMAALLAEHGAKVASLDVTGIPAAVAQGNIPHGLRHRFDTLVNANIEASG